MSTPTEEQERCRLWEANMNLQDSPTSTLLPNELQALCERAFVFPAWLAADSVRDQAYVNFQTKTLYISQTQCSSLLFNPLRAALCAGTPISSWLEDKDMNQHLHFAMPSIIAATVTIKYLSPIPSNATIVRLIFEHR